MSSLEEVSDKPLEKMKRRHRRSTEMNLGTHVYLSLSSSQIDELVLEPDDFGHAAIMRRVKSKTLIEILGCDSEGYCIPGLLLAEVNGECFLPLLHKDVLKRLDDLSNKKVDLKLKFCRATEKLWSREIKQLELEDNVLSLEEELRLMKQTIQKISSDVERIIRVKNS